VAGGGLLLQCPLANTLIVSIQKVLPQTRWWDRPKKFFFFSPSPEHENRRFDFFAARPPYQLFLRLWMELNNDCSIHLILHHRALPLVIQYWRCNTLPLSKVHHQGANFVQIWGKFLGQRRHWALYLAHINPRPIDRCLG
jgi:hypothetical protein